MAMLQPAAGGVLGVGGTVALREMFDQDGGLMGDQGTLLDRVTRPSVIYGVGSGAVAGALWYLDDSRMMNTTLGPIDNSLYATYSLTGVSSGAASALFPVDASGSPSNGGNEGNEQSFTMTRSNGAEDLADAEGSPPDAGGQSSGEFAPAQ